MVVSLPGWLSLRRRKPAGGSLLPFLWTFLRPYRLRAAEAFAAMVLAAALTVPLPLVTIYLVDEVFAAGSRSTLHVVCAGVLAVSILSTLLSLLQSYLLTVFARRVFFDMEVTLTRRLLAQSAAYFRKASPGYLATRASDDVRQLGALMAGTWIQAMNSAFVLVVGAAVMTALSPGLAAILLAHVPVLAVVSVLVGQRVHDLNAAVQERRGQTQAVRIESLENITVVKAFGAERRQVGLIANRLHQELDAGLARDVRVLALSGVQSLVHAAGFLVLLWVGGLEVMNGQLSLGQLLALNSLLALVLTPTVQLSNVYMSVKMALGILQRVRDFAGLPLHRERAGKPLLDIGPGRVQFEKVSFRLPGGGAVLHDVSATFPAGRITAVVGGTGMGKSTLVRLLLQLETPSRGSILIDGRDSSEYDPRSIRSHIGYVEQEVHLFSATIRQNILYGRPRAAEDALAWAIEISDCAEFLSRFPDGMDTRIGANGVELSRGQKQRVCLARAMVRRPRILVLDETTASLDPETERTVIRALTQAGEGRTTVYVSHRLASLDFADRVVVMNGGRVTGEGSFQDWVSGGGPEAADPGR